MAGSQLTQLKTALNNAGLGRKSYSKKEKKAFKKGGARETDRAKTFQKLEDIKRGLNKFDTTETKLKHDVGGRQLKGVTGNPSTAKQAGLEKRRAQLLTEHQARDHRGTFNDRRFGEADPTMSVEDRMLERYTRERQRGQGKKGLFNLEEGDDVDDLEDGNVLGGLTHGGRSVLDLPGDDFMLQGLGDDEDPEDKHIDRRTVQKTHFGGFQEPEEDEEQPERKKSKQEVMAEVMAKSKSYKAERQHQNDLDADLRDELDGEINDLRALLQEGPSDPASFRRQPVSDKEDAEYAQFVKTLAFEARAKPKDRTKTEDELAVEEKEKLEKAEAKRLRRMRGEESEDEDSRGKKRKVDDRREGDDLGDDFIDEDEEDLLGPGLTREGLEAMGASAAKGAALEDEAEEDDDEEDDDDEEGDGSEGEDVDEEDDEEDVSDMEDLDEGSDLGSDEEPEIALVTKRKRQSAAKTTEIPYTFICPSNIDELEDIMEPLDDSAIPIVVQRIRAIHHPSLAQGNKEKLQGFFGVLLDYTLILASRPVPAFAAISSLTPHLVALVKLNPIAAAGHFIGKVSLMQKNLTRGLARGATRLESKTYPGAPELVILRLVGSFWSTSDFSHPVVAPSILLIGQYLGHGRLRRTADIASGLMLCSLLAQYEAESKRFLPEGVNFLAASILALLPRRKDSRLDTRFPDLVAPACASSLSITTPKDPSEIADVSALLGSEGEQSKADLLAVALRLIETYAALYSSSNAFIESFQPLAHILSTSKMTKLSESLKQRLSSTTKTLARMLNLAITSRQPLALQSHKPVPIASHAPRFEEGYAPGKRYDPDVERNAASKLKAQYKQERKGAIRELRKDNRFLAGEKAREQAEKDREYNAKMRRAEGSITVERAEEKAMEREKAREKRRAGRS